MFSTNFEQDLARTLLYYEIFRYPLTAKELFVLFPTNSLTFEEFKSKLAALVLEEKLKESFGFYYLNNGDEDFSLLRMEKEQSAKRMLRLAKFFTFIVKQFPFVRGVFLSGELSKNVATKGSDIDYVIVTAPNRLWFTRSVLILLKKIFLFNNKKYFCLNYFVTEQQFELPERSYYSATEIAHLKPLYNFPLFLKYINSNGWIKTYFPNYSVFGLTSEPTFETPGLLQKVFEFFLQGDWLDTFDLYLMDKMKRVWEKRYNMFENTIHERLFRCTPNESRAFIGNFSDRIEKEYEEKLKTHNLI
ncbi:MAG: hypothetical protein HY960_00490 [Ignavibacteriae bacterium]|nr:hypothetical protein [Ignavibacteriota bacterium]